jgi:kynurenine formamidase
MAADKMMTMSELLKGLPTNFGRWGDDDEIGGLNFLTPNEIERGLSSVKKYTPFTLSVVINHPQGDPLWPGRSGAIKLMTQDKGHYMAGKLQPFPGGLEYADDYLCMFPQGTTHFDALGHPWYDDTLYNGYDAHSTIGGLAKASVLPLAMHSASGPGVLLDIARFRKKKSLERAETFGLSDLLECAKQEKITIEKHDILLLRTGWLSIYYDHGPDVFYKPPFIEPGLTFSRELVEWFHEMEIPLLATDTIGNETTFEPNTGIAIPLHAALIRNLGVIFNEIVWLEALADDCAIDGQYRFFYTAAPLKISRGTGAPVNPIVLK